MKRYWFFGFVVVVTLAAGWFLLREDFPFSVSNIQVGTTGPVRAGDEVTVTWDSAGQDADKAGLLLFALQSNDGARLSFHGAPYPNEHTYTFLVPDWCDVLPTENCIKREQVVAAGNKFYLSIEGVYCRDKNINPYYCANADRETKKFSEGLFGPYSLADFSI